ncbi:MAG: enoyl-CoA hydratase/isomerase family protein [Deltaproteobacteria bacterium]|nr:enoyl-CoA hydratase/isomerase family protein [Deltaproteobacteria bacterium]
MAGELIRVQHDERGFAVLSLERPEALNSMTPAMGEELGQAVEELCADESLRAVILTGAGKAFCAGGDLEMLARDAQGGGPGGPAMGATPREFYDRFLSIRKLPVPTIAAINGPAIGAGLCLALACDLRVAASGATMGMTFVRVGIHPGMGATFWLPTLVGVAKAWELLFTGRLIDAREAYQIGLVNRVVQRDRVVDEARELAAEIAEAGPVAVRLLKETLRRSLDQGLERALEDESRQQARTFRTEDAREGIRAITEKRKAAFKGR